MIRAMVVRSEKGIEPEDFDSSTFTRPLLLRGVPQRYSWGKCGAASRIASFLSPPIDSSGPLAEYWIGTHPKGCGAVLLPGARTESLGELISLYPEQLLGTECVSRFGKNLPFLLKVLSINPDYGLSVQVHPDRPRAESLHRENPVLYPDPNHKPEIGIPLSPVTLLYGFRPLDEIIRLFQHHSELQAVIGEAVFSHIVRGRTASDPVATLRELYRALLTSSEASVATYIGALAVRLLRENDRSEEGRWLEILRRRYGNGDVGLLALFVMNIIRIEPGSAIFIAPNVPHAYLDGDLVECMACSDNVVRAGLTSKHRDIQTLLEIADYTSSTPHTVRPQIGSSGKSVFGTPAEEFCISVIPLVGSPIHLESHQYPQILLCLGEGCEVHFEGEVFTLIDGGALFIPPGKGTLVIRGARTQLYVATVGESKKEHT